MFSVRIDPLPTKDAVKNRLIEFLESDRTSVVFTPNPEILLLARRDKAYTEVLNSADLSLPDGFGLSLVSLLKPRKLLRRYTGIDTAEMLIELARERKTQVMFLGGRHGSAIRAAENLTVRYPSLRITAAGDNIEITNEGTTISSENETRMKDAIYRTAPSIILVGLGAPKQEQWITRHRDDFPSIRVMMTVGGTFDIWSGRLRRAPKFVRTLGLEWLWRVAQEPKRLPRILRATLIFPWHALISRD